MIAALLDFIPNVGPILAFVPAALFALLQGPTQVVYVVALYGAIQIVEGYLLTPLIERTRSVPPALSLTALLVAALLFGWLGLLLAAPQTAALLVMVQMVYVEDTLGERDAR